jgi:hypothetical protein
MKPLTTENIRAAAAAYYAAGDVAAAAAYYAAGDVAAAFRAAATLASLTTTGGRP